jgi:hypothetical protein
MGVVAAGDDHVLLPVYEAICTFKGNPGSAPGADNTVLYAENCLHLRKNIL